MKKFLLKIWMYILKNVQLTINKNIINDDGNLYVVYFSEINTALYICKSGSHAIELYEQFVKLNHLLNRDFVKVYYGNVDYVFKRMIPKSLMDVVFTWPAPEEERKRIYRYIADVPLITGGNVCHY